ncbi:MAG: LVIVD repeat-containing protein [Acidimicrobiales bacterium]
MRAVVRGAAIVGSLVMLAAFPVAARADHETRPHTGNLHAKGHSPHVASFSDPAPVRHINSDLAFWGKLAFHGNYDGFRIVDIAEPDNPVELSHQRCNGDQGDIVVWGNILVRSWNSPAPAGRFCDGVAVPVGFEGVHVFDVADTADPTLVASVPLECGSHTVTVGGVVGGNLIVYSNNSSSFGCIDGTPANDNPAGDYMDVISIPLAAPGSASLLRREELAGPATAVRTGCHDAGVILGSVNKAACASADTINVWDVGANAAPGGSITDPHLLFTISEPGVGQAGTNGRWHSAAFTWDGKVLVAGWEPGGGADAECEAADPDVDKSLFFYDASTGAKLGQWVLPRAQGADENCTVHNYNIVPLRSGRYVAVGGHYQAGTWVVEFTDPAAAVTLAWSDPAALGPGPFCGGRCQLGGAWSSYWYNNFIYESDITKGLNVFRYSGSEMAGPVRLPHLNPQTQEFSLTRR